MEAIAIVSRYGEILSFNYHSIEDAHIRLNSDRDSGNAFPIAIVSNGILYVPKLGVLTVAHEEMIEQAKEKVSGIGILYNSIESFELNNSDH